MLFVGSSSHVYCDKFQNRLTAGFWSTVLFLQRSKLPSSFDKTANMSLFCLERLGSITQKQKLQTSEISSKAIKRISINPSLPLLTFHQGRIQGGRGPRLHHCLQDRIISLLQVMHTAKYTKVEPSYKNCHIDKYIKTITIVAHAAKCWAQCHIFTRIQFSHSQLYR